MNKIFSISCILIILLPIFCFAQTDINPIASTSFGELIDSIAGVIFRVAVVLGPVMIIVGGFLMLFAGMDPSKIVLGKKIILYTSVVFGIILIIKVLIHYFVGDLTLQ